MPPARFVVADAFQLSPGRCVLLPGFAEDDPVVRMGDCLILRRPDGTFFRTVVYGFEMVNIRPRRVSIRAPISLPPPLTKNDVPTGTVVTVLAAPARPDDVFMAEVTELDQSELEPGARLVLVLPDDSTLGASPEDLRLDELPRGTLVFAATSGR